MDLSEFIALWLLEGTSWYLIFMFFIVVIKAADALLSIKWNPELIPRILKSLGNSVKARIISLSLLFFISVVSIVLQSYTYVT